MNNATVSTCCLCGNDPHAPCAGLPGCHGYYEGCDCDKCQREHRRCRKVALTGRGPMPARPGAPKPF